MKLLAKIMAFIAMTANIGVSFRQVMASLAAVGGCVLLIWIGFLAAAPVCRSIKELSHRVSRYRWERKKARHMARHVN